MCNAVGHVFTFNPLLVIGIIIFFGLSGLKKSNSSRDDFKERAPSTGLGGTYLRFFKAGSPPEGLSGDVARGAAFLVDRMRALRV